MQSLLSTRNIAIICFILWAILVLRGAMTAKDEDDFVVTVSQQEVQSFAKAQLSGIQQRSVEEDQEFCAIIFEDADGNLATTPLTQGKKASCDIAFFDEPGMRPLASFHTHAAYDRAYDSETPSVLDMESDIESGMDGYIATPGGRFWRVNAAAQKADMICGTACLRPDPDYRPCPRFEPAKSYTLSQLQSRQSGDNGLC